MKRLGTVNLRKRARGKPCLVRIPYICNNDSDTVVLAHIRVPGTAGIGQKPCDLAGVYACSDCHDVIDGRVMVPNLSKPELKAMILDGLCRTLADVAKDVEG